MTRRTNARVAGYTFLFYFAAGILSLVLSNRAIHGEDTAAKLASIAQHVTDMRLVVVLTLLTSFSALVLGVTLYAITREQDRDLARVAMACRFVECLSGNLAIPKTLGLLWLATATGANAPDTGAAHALGAFLLRAGPGLGVSFFAVSSLLFCYLLLRGRMIPVPLAWIGVLASIPLVVTLPLQLAGFLPGGFNWFLWLPLAGFEIPFGLWLIIKGVAPPRATGVTGPSRPSS
jgi:hypothetical protein